MTNAATAQTRADLGVTNAATAQAAAEAAQAAADLTYGTSLTTTDIHGCKTTTKGLGSFHTRERREYKKTNITSDINGAQPDTLKKSPETTRRTHPLMPDYQMPGRLDIAN